MAAGGRRSARRCSGSPCAPARPWRCRRCWRWPSQASTSGSASPASTWRRPAAAGCCSGPSRSTGASSGPSAPPCWPQADYRAILAEIPALATLVGLAFVGAMLNASGIELATGEPVDLNRDLRGVGIANLLAGLGGGVAGYHVLGGTLLANRLTGARLALDRRRRRAGLRRGAGRRRLGAVGAADRRLRGGAGLPRDRPALPVALGRAAAPAAAGLPARPRASSPSPSPSASSRRSGPACWRRRRSSSSPTRGST